MGKPRVQLVKKDLGWNEFFKRAKEIRNKRVRVGVLGDVGAGREQVGNGSLTLAELAAVLHFGTRPEDGKQHIPPRPFLTLAFEEGREELIKLGEDLMGRVLDGKVTTDRALNIMGGKLAAMAKRKITDGEGVPPPNAASTIAGKGSDRPLVDDGRLVKAITWSPGEGEGDDGGDASGE